MENYEKEVFNRNVTGYAGVVGNPICNTATPILGGFTNEVTYLNADGSSATMYANWRLCYLIGALPIIYGIVLHFFMHETPHWYANAGRMEEACKALNHLQRSAGQEETHFDPKLLVVPPKPAKTSSNIRASSSSPRPPSGPLTSSASSACTA